MNIVRDPGHTLKRFGAVLLLVSLSAVYVVAQSLTFAVVGDTGDNSADLTAIANQMHNYRTNKDKFEFVLLLGDNVYPDGIGKGLNVHFELPFKELLDSGVKFYAVLGNHDIRKGTEIQIKYPHFNMGGRRYYSFTLGDGLVDFFALDSTALSEEAEELVETNLVRLQSSKQARERSLATLREAVPTETVTTALANNEARLTLLDSRILESEQFLKDIRATKSKQLAWLEQELPKSKARWKVVFLHHAIYSSAYKGFPFKGHGKDKGVLRLRELLKVRFMQNQVDVVFAGHDHVFEKTRVQVSPVTNHQITYITAGAGSERRKGDLDKKNSFFEFGEDRLHSFLVVRLSPNQMEIDVIDNQGKNIFPRFAITKP